MRCAVSFINSLYSAFGSGIVGGETGILLQNRGDGFTLKEGHLNEYAPGKRPYHTIIPGMVTRNGKLYMSYGLMGGPMQPQGHVQFLLSHIEHGLTPQEAADAGGPRIVGQLLGAKQEHRLHEAGFDARCHRSNLPRFGPPLVAFADR